MKCPRFDQSLLEAVPIPGRARVSTETRRFPVHWVEHQTLRVYLGNCQGDGDIAGSIGMMDCPRERSGRGRFDVPRHPNIHHMVVVLCTVEQFCSQVMSAVLTAGCSSFWEAT